MHRNTPAGRSDLDAQRSLAILVINLAVAERGTVLPDATRRSGRGSLATILATAILLAFFVFGITAVSMPGNVLGATVTKAAVCSANLRTSASTSARSRTSIKVGTTVTVVATSPVAAGERRARARRSRAKPGTGSAR